MTKKAALAAMLTLGLAIPVAMAMQDEGAIGKGKESKPQAAIGKPAPDFTLKDTEGKEHKLSQYKGKIVVLEWTNHICPFVKYHQSKAETMQATCEEFKGKDVVWLAVNSSDFCEEKKDEIRAWIEETEIPYPMLLDAPGKVGHLYGAKTTPHMFVIDKEGVLQYEGAIDDDASLGGDASRNYVQDAVEALLEGSTVSQKQTKPYGCAVKYKQ